MPLYEYQCDDCSHRFELIQKFSDKLASTCPSCGGAVKKLVSSPAIQFKGTGWYVTDYARKPSPDEGSSAERKAESKATGSTSDKPTTSASESKSKSESKPKSSSTTK